MPSKKLNFTIIVDSREQQPLDFLTAKAETGTLQTGDYSIKGFENDITIERKSLCDLTSSLGVDRERFMREVQRLRAYEYAAIVIEAGLSDLVAGRWRSKIHPNAVIGTLLSLSTKNDIHIFWCNDSKHAAMITEGLFRQFLRKKIGMVERINKITY